MIGLALFLAFSVRVGKAVEGHRSPRRCRVIGSPFLKRVSVLDCASPLALCSRRASSRRLLRFMAPMHAQH